MSTGVVCDGFLVSVIEGQRVGVALATADRPRGSWGWRALIEAAAPRGIGDVYLSNRLWFDPSTDRLPDDLTVEVTGDQGGAWRWRVAGRGAVLNVVDVAADLGQLAGPFGNLAAGELVDVFAALERLLGVPWASSVGRTAERLILSTHPRGKGGTLLDRSPVVPEPAAGSTLEGPWSAWRRELTAAERKSGWLHVFDANAQYLAAWSTVEVGHGVPVHHGGGGFDQRIAGVWRVPELCNVAPPFGERLPRPWLDSREWFTTPTIVRALEVCEGLAFPDVVESWRWPARSRFLRGACERLRDARAAAVGERERTGRVAWATADEAAALEAVRRHVVADVTLDAVKAVYRVQTGRFGMAGRDAASPWARPDWGHFVRAQARVNLHRRLAKLTWPPFGIATDGLLFLSPISEPVAFAASIGLPVGGGLGEFHHAGTIAAGELDANTLATGRPTGILKAMRGAPVSA